MRKVLLFYILLLGAFIAKAQEIPFIKAGEIKKWKANSSDTLYVINFWATWCKPCLEEMPAFEKIISEFEGEKVRFILVSNDFKKQIDTKLKPYLADKNFRKNVFYMDETNPNNWIELVNVSWGGSIPATLFRKGSSDKEKFFSGPLTYEEMKSIITQMIHEK